MNISMLLIILFNICLLLVHVKSTPMIIKYWQKAYWKKENYQGIQVFIGYGLILVIHITLTYIMLYGLYLLGLVHTFNLKILLVLIPVMIMTIAGWIDDFFGDEEIKGLKGHLLAFINGRFTSGLLKLICGVLCSFSLAFLFANTIPKLILYSLIMMLSIHIVNLFDVRPSRCFKFFFANTLILSLFVHQMIWTQQILPVLFACLPIFALDKNRIVMLGDTGSNVLGLLLGLWIVQTELLEIQYLYLLCFSVLAILAERTSFSQFIQKQPFLAKLDQWGVRNSKG